AEGSTERLENVERVRRIEADIDKRGRDEVVDRAAYTWFNRLCALRFMDANGYTPTPAVTPRAGSTQPAILADAALGVYDPEYGVSQDVRQRVAGLLTGSIASSNAAEDAYALLLGAVCSSYAESMGYLFAEDVASSLLMPQGLLAQGSILSRIVSEMDEEACSDVEVLGWLYQFYIAERKDEYFASKKKATAADIPAATQLFTPKWIVAFLAENSLGRLWMLNNPGSELAGSMEYYVAPEGDEPHIEVSSADEIRVLDPACGSGHILVYAFDLLFRMYEEEGWPTEDIPQMILENNLFGLEIDRRAAEIASFALEMKARERDPRWFEKRVDAQVHVLEPVTLLPQELELVTQLSERRSLLEAMAHMDEVGSLYVPDPLDESVLLSELEHVEHDGSLFAESAIAKLKMMLANVQGLSRSFHCVIANPPYMTKANMNPWLNEWVTYSFPEEKGDFSTCFLRRAFSFAKGLAPIGMVTPSTWLFISSFAQAREKLLKEASFLSMIQLSYHGFPDVTVPTCTFVVAPGLVGAVGSFIRLQEFDRPQWQAERALEAIQDKSCGWFYKACSEEFGIISG
ncbi:MAG: BREX-1 system adenine-specific DNA-methyltransferase PglX, partial [Atopobiaceae bacterium]|nr:BREX-1 system adenine-specific DNA-methyltransferase PglX [Atopobiaceae bacterium]